MTMALRFLPLLLFIVACVMIFTQPPAGLQTWAQPLDQPVAPTQSQPPSKPLNPVPASYAVIMDLPTLILKPADGWICRCLLLSRPLCSCALVPTAKEDPKIPIYY